jgi:hypothetical protein
MRTGLWLERRLTDWPNPTEGFFSFVFIVHRYLALRSLAATMPHIDPATSRMRRLPADADFEEAEKTKNRKRCCEA